MRGLLAYRVEQFASLACGRVCRCCHRDVGCRCGGVLDHVCSRLAPSDAVGGRRRHVLQIVHFYELIEVDHVACVALHLRLVINILFKKKTQVKLNLILRKLYPIAVFKNLIINTIPINYETNISHNLELRIHLKIRILPLNFVSNFPSNF